MQERGIQKADKTTDKLRECHGVSLKYLFVMKTSFKYGPSCGGRREYNFLPVNKTEKTPKMAFTHTFGFHGEKSTDERR